MNRRNVFLTLVVLAGAVLAAPTANAAVETTLKIGFVDAPQLLAKAPQTAAAREELKKEFGSREQELASEQKALKKDEADFQRNSVAMSASAKSAAQLKLRQKLDNFNRDMSAFHDDFETRRDELLQGIQKRIFNAVVKVAKAGGYDLVLTGGVVYASAKVDLTKQVLDDLTKNKH